MQRYRASLLIFACLLGYAIAFWRIHNDKREICTGLKIDISSRIENLFKTPNPKRDVKFFLYTRKNPKHGHQLNTGDINSVKNSNFDPSKPLRFLIHGFQQTLESCFFVELINAYLQKGDFNVIAVDWSKIGTRLIYTKVIKYLKPVADVVNDFITFLYVYFRVSYDNIYLIGHSLGAHLAGLMGRGLLNDQYNTIFGLDPAGPGFERGINSDVLQSDDAKYVETIHTDMNKFGYNGQIGHASIYPDFGFSQKKCAGELLRNPICDHVASFYYFAESLNIPKCYLVNRCYNFEQIKNHQCECYPGLKQDCRQGYYQLGGEPSQQKTGVFYLHVPEDTNQCAK